MAEPVDRRSNPALTPADQVPTYITPGDPVQEEVVVEEDRHLDPVENARAQLFTSGESTTTDTSWERAEEIKFQALTTEGTEEAVGDSLPATLPYQTNIDHLDTLRRLDDQFAMDTVAGDSTQDPVDQVDVDANADLTEY